MLNWKKANFANYEEAYELYGGGISTSPEVLQFLHARFDLNEKYFVKTDNSNNIIAAVCVWDSNYLAGEPSLSQKIGNPYPVCTDEILFPIKPEIKCILPFKSKFLSHKNAKTVINSSHIFNSHREICFVKELSGKTINTRNRELKNFLKKDGSLINIFDISTEEFVEIYDELFFMRRKCHINKIAIKELLNNIPSLKFGHILFWKNKPASVQFVIKKQCVNWINFDFINTGRDMSLQEIPVGTIAMWINIKNAIALAEKNNIEMRFSFGRPTFNYKERWCRREKLFRVVTL
ncbi:hypothetical protein [Xenorhabdus eapokensis]|uniref:Antimicrobial peptide resistance protein Mig-14 n=1 Tax=Xenorhabdus eapokensis TaxID=1873482 RepID=A0A1Q5TKX6_9GAMM|nr:hypothetical protein [Xenorhabdus eapokensis]OKP00871.1 antimicrobial peptide resistance protein Mig-14 [Xenorhabdus eapokensis]